MARIALITTIVVLLLVATSDRCVAAGSCAAPAITNMAVDTTNGPWSCHINDATDKVAMQASATDTDQTASDPCHCESGNRINLAATTWVVSDGVLDSPTGATNQWKAGSSIGSKTLTVTFKDMDDGADCDDDDVVVQKTLTAFKVGVNLATSGGSSCTWWEDTVPGGIGFGGQLTENAILGTAPAAKSDGANSVATWTLNMNPSGTPMKQHIHANASAWGGAGSTAGRVYCVTANSDWFDYGKATLTVSVSLGLVSFTASHDFMSDNAVSTLSAGAAMGSELHADYTTCKIELKSATTTGPSDTKQISHSP